MKTILKLKRVLIADDHELILTGISDILVNRFSLKRENLLLFTNPELVLNTIKDTGFDLYILDLEFQNISGFDLIKSIRKIDKNSNIIVCTMHQEVWNVNRLLEMNINGIVLKNTANIHLEHAIEAVCNGQKFLCPKFKDIKAKSQLYKKGRKVGLFTKREQEVLRYIVDGYTSKEIALKLEISENAIEGHRKNLFMKLDVSNVMQLVRVAICYRLVEI
ncbi:response regulator transcription factor [Dysgonomonas sp. 520]|uniref:LuxR C-terminal-related transcriptional regulator n=1 Tax=Dysgonomonas sp. 520 TaxID=2302931 RepID=UPI0013CF6D89|nr:response regulator transcription factor [Dysgonomonas sp. 520]NDW08655.1 DNA-binding response regulator [Dysgonomonas sp. 520]